MLPRGKSNPFTLLRVIEFTPELCMHSALGHGVHPVFEPLLAGSLEVKDEGVVLEYLAMLIRLIYLDVDRAGR